MHIRPRIRKILLLAGACASAALAQPASATAGLQARHGFQDREEAKLAKMLEGRVAGEPRSCIAAFDVSRMQILNHTAIVYKSGDTVWVSRPADPHSLDASDIVVIKRTGGQLCKQDVIKTVDRIGGFTTGIVFLGDFVPYRKK